ncbi:unnamed protein product [Anisakis simplex]|uniref:Structural protein n=1 Tax=Anisakis simplex TaxID=6269 RepID=A0A0M3JGR1_ANISI|nr:unnamed protein product [Anisakis simplex]
MSGLNDLNDRTEYSIVHDLIRRSNDVVYDRSLFDSLKQKIYLYQNHRQLETAFSIPPNGWQLEFPTIPKTETEFDNQRDMWNEAGIGPQVSAVVCNEEQRGLLAILIEIVHKPRQNRNT